MSSASNKRHARAQRRMRRKPQEGLLLTALIDIFTNLLFFLLVLSQNPTKPPEAEGLRLPKSVASKQLQDQRTVVITNAGVFVLKVQGKASNEDAPQAQKKEELIPFNSISTRLASQLPKTDTQGGGYITIMGHDQTSYEVLKQVMQVCANQGYSKLTFAVIHGGSRT